MSQEEIGQSDEKKSRKSSIKEIVEILIFLGLAILVVFSFNWILGAILNTNTPLVVVTSGSMEPIYYGSNRPGFGGENDIRKDMLIVRGVDPSKIKAGDTIVFYCHNISDPNQIDYVKEPIVHRVNRVYLDNETGEYWFTTMGDNNNDFIEGIGISETTIHESRLIGKIVGRVPYLGGIVSYFKTLTGRIILIVFVIVIILGTWLFSSFGEKKDKELFEEKETNEDKNDTSKEQQKAKSNFHKTMKTYYRKIVKHKHIVVPSMVLAVIICIPIIDSLAANWGAIYGVENAVFDGAKEYSLTDDNYLFIFADVTLSCPGHWHQKFRSFSLIITNITTGEILGENNWSIVYNFEGSRTINSGAWVRPSDVVIGQYYNMTITANLQNKFGRSWTDAFTITFMLTLRL